MDQQLLSELNEVRGTRKAAIVLKNIASETSVLIGEDGQRPQNVPAGLDNDIQAVFRSGKSRMVMLDDQEYFLNVYLPPTRMVVIGAVHISQCLASIAKNTDFELEIIDPRTAFATPERFEGLPLSVEWPETVLAQKPLDAYCALIAVTHDPKIDDFAIAAALKADCFYVGALGSRKTHAKRVARLLEQGIEEAKINQIHAPIGLNIGAANPAEIAVAILAQVIGSFRQRGVAF
ncbi:MAG: XdhC/CoxF family protein [Hyphomicrobiales bacterium]|nr:XdhC/CoxF family protein [Hyphomicrobiales bacterium]